MEVNVEKFKNIILDVQKDSIGEELGIEPGDILLKVNNIEIKDIIEYMFLISDEYIEMEIKKRNGEIEVYSIEKDYDEEMGIIFENPIIDKAKSCKNKCIFCFIDQLPPNMRKTLYFKDDDSRLSFLQGNFITLTNMSDEDMEKIIKYRISPINVSIHTTNPDLRMEMLNNNTACNLHERLEKLAEAHININGQIVLCPNVNDKENLDRTIKDLYKLYPSVKSVAIVPVGITKYRENLYPLKIFNRESARETIEQIKRWQGKFLEEKGIRFVHLSDEFYIMANEDFPSYDEYEGFPQIENGVGLMVKLKGEFEKYLDSLDGNRNNKTISVATGRSAKKFIDNLARNLSKKYPNININVYEIKNNFFGETITVAGLITATDIIDQLKDKRLGERLLITESMLRADTNVFLDDLTIDDVEKSLKVKIQVTKNNGKDFIENIIN
ncbi:MAG: DUF512 domain-containing protein [Anaeromicrobium sp.]|jgi:putative radical SAM enzyme (TIGR03279 family)|uniref:DUF512 domain-containing protein n=1 Tax=Anaeromicrobium sp. TaxID=1929132 RepID=UPI0025DCD55D|nr:DUF512 domain-containing protein [Anaeromicrobium sp.]MCT4592905.1 DUF512 domain-containing protein [Anaeromicrobium sp.]